ncbi:MAG: hypothetical protein J5563_04990, partial [Clostridia bacterium]|nr:hypothetical protein [Clostridia bacterium]
PQDEIGGLNNYQRDGVWFMLFFKGDIETDNMEDCRWTKYKQSKYFKIYPKVEQLNVEGPCYESQAEPPSEDDFEYKVVYGESGYVIELAYTVPAATATLAAGSEIAFDIEVYDVNDPNATYRYYLANGYEPFTEGYATALGAKLVLAEASSVNTGDLTAVMVLIGSVAVVGTALVIRKKH